MRANRSPLVLLGAGLALAACGGFDAGNPYRVRASEGSTNATEPTPGGGDGDDDPRTNDASDGGPQTIVPPSEDSGTTTSPKPTAFSNASAYVATTGPVTRKPQHNFAGATPTTNPAGRACMQCHGAAGPAPRFLVAGTVYKDATGTPAGQVEIRLVDADGIARSVYSNDDGNFFFPAATGAIKLPALVGARDANTTKLMVNSGANGNCNSCHRAGGTTPPLVVD